MTDQAHTATSAIDAERLVHNSAYNDARVLQLEEERIFRRIWLFLCHASELEGAGSYFSTRVAGNPVLVVRGTDGEIRSFYNVCRHRGATVIEGEGTCEVFRCSYHWWTYDLEGNLQGVPGYPAYEGTGVTKAKFGLVGIRTEVFNGLVFATLNPDPPPLIEYLGRAADVIDEPFGKVDLRVIHKARFEVTGNWKLIAENQLDGYHVPFVHPVFRAASPAQPYEILDNGHAVQMLKTDDSKLPDELQRSATGHPFPGHENGEGYIVVLFPDLNVTVRYNFIALSHSTALDAEHTVVERRILGMVNDSEEATSTRMAAARAMALDTYSDEDMPTLEMQARGVRNTGVPFSLIARGEEATSGTRGDDNRLRNWWRTWRAYMGTDHNASPWYDWAQ